MEVILLQDVDNVGQKFQETEVANGYGTNYLIPNGLAVVANEANQKRFAKKKAEAEEKRQAEREKLAEALSDINDAEIVIVSENAGEQGQLYSGIYPKDIAVAVEEELGVAITAADIQREQPISKVGEYEVSVAILEKEAVLTVVVEAAETSTEENDADEETEEEDEAVDAEEAPTEDGESEESAEEEA